jgi:hypothetical protein
MFTAAVAAFTVTWLPPSMAYLMFATPEPPTSVALRLTVTGLALL